MKKPVRIRFRHDAEMSTGAFYAKGAEFELPSDEVAHNLYGDAIDIISYADGEKYDLNLREQAAERKEAAAEDVVVDEKPAKS
jgi:predicted alpha/beta-hydrolase family hydrolase